MRSSEKWRVLVGHWTVKLGRQNGTVPLTKMQLCEYENQFWKLLLGLVIIMPSLIVQWPARIFHF